MGPASLAYKEIRFVIEEELTHAYVFIEAYGDSPIGVQGWHHKVFPPSIPTIDILGKHMFGHDDDACVLWGLEAPRAR